MRGDGKAVGHSPAYGREQSFSGSHIPNHIVIHLGGEVGCVASHPGQVSSYTDRFENLSMLVYALTVALSAFLLFEIQPVIAKTILPWFGGSSSVWNTCMVFFQTTLLGGYAYAHWLDTRLSPRKQAIVHTALLASSVLLLPVAPDTSWKGSALQHPILRILGLLSVTVGLPYFLVSTTGPLLQAWYARSFSGVMPYRLYALSNLASMLALLTYPVLVEPNMAVRSQGIAWSAGYALFAVLCAATAWWSARSREEAPAASAADRTLEPAPAWGLRLLWMMLAACGSTLLLSTTTYLTQDVAAIPFLWVLPLSVYLLTFILCFEAPRLYQRRGFLRALAPALAGMAYILYTRGSGLKVLSLTVACAAALFVCSMACHGELVRRKPHPRHLTIFYVMLSAGGALGGLFVGLVAPSLFNAYYEFPIGLGLCALLVVVVLWPERRVTARAALAGALCAYLIWLGIIARNSVQGYRLVTRNFYSQLRVRDTDEDDGVGVRRKLLHGTINHGEQILSETYRRKPVSYFCPDTGIGRAMLAGDRARPRRIGILGLGCGTLIAYGRRGDNIRIYEINPQVLKIAQSDFTYIRDSEAQVETVLGDGRLMLEREPDQHFDILVMDAFSGDSVPVHLITLEAFRTYLRHLRPDGILAVNISNKYLRLEPVMEGAASRFGKVALAFDFSPDEEDNVCFSATWVLIMDPRTRERLADRLRGGRPINPVPGFRPWTDDYSNMFRILK